MNNDSELWQIVDDAIESFNQQERYLIETDLSERCICARFALHLSETIRGTDFKDYTVDVEYNRGADGYERAPKRMYNAPITVDLIVHKRGYDNKYGFDNLICIEMKKTTNRQGCASDEERLKNMTDFEHGFHYKAGFMILIDMKNIKLRIKHAFKDGQVIA